MDDEWEGISLASLQDNPGSKPVPARTNIFRALSFQEFLTRRPLNSNSTDPQSYSSPESSLHPPATFLSLNSYPVHPIRSHSSFQPQNVFPNSLNLDPFDSLGSSCSRLPEISSSRDRRNKRMIKNRESASRSRARKQEMNPSVMHQSFYSHTCFSQTRAYTNQLELEVAHLMEENARLKRQQQQLMLAAATEVPKKHTHHRSSTAPF